jgi:AMMECR1 domain-containing protein
MQKRRRWVCTCAAIFLAVELSPLRAVTAEKSRAALESVVDAVVASLASGRIQQISAETEDFLRKQASRKGMFVSIFDAKTRRLRGCMGTLLPQKANVYEEAVHWATMAMMHDPRGAMTASVQDNRRYAAIISFIDGVEAVADPFEVNSITHGILVRFPGREELVLPGEAFTTAYALKIISGKLGFDARRPGAEYFKIYAERFGKGVNLFKKIDGGYGG